MIEHFPSWIVVYVFMWKIRGFPCDIFSWKTPCVWYGDLPKIKISIFFWSSRCPASIYIKHTYIILLWWLFVGPVRIKFMRATIINRVINSNFKIINYDPSSWDFFCYVIYLRNILSMNVCVYRTLVQEKSLVWADFLLKLINHVQRRDGYTKFLWVLIRHIGDSVIFFFY